MKKLRKGLSFLAVAVLFLSINATVYADGVHSSDQDVLNAAQKFRNGGKSLPPEGQGSANKQTGTHSHDGNASGGGHSHGSVIETPPNMKVLGTFGGINLSFVLIGLWNRSFRRKGEEHGNSGKKTARN